jgi:hypothetical protein
MNSSQSLDDVAFTGAKWNDRCCRSIAYVLYLKQPINQRVSSKYLSIMEKVVSKEAPSQTNLG